MPKTNITSIYLFQNEARERWCFQTNSTLHTHFDPTRIHTSPRRRRRDFSTADAAGHPAREPNPAVSFQNIRFGGRPESRPGHILGTDRSQLRRLGPRGVRQNHTPSEFQTQQFLQLRQTA